MPTRDYDPGKVALTFAGINVTGFAKGTFIEVTRDSETWKDDVGSGGEVMRARSRDRRGTIKFTLMQGSPCNDILSSKLQAGEDSGLDKGPVAMSDNSGSTVAQAADAWLQKWPDVKRGDEVDSVEWMLRCGELKVFVGGNDV